MSSDVVAGERWPETVTVIRPLRVLKGQLQGSLVLHQVGGRLSEGLVYLLPGRPEYTVGEEVVVFAIGRDEGDFQTAEMVLGKFAVERDESGRLYAVPGLARAALATDTCSRAAGFRRFAELRPDFEQSPSARFAPRRFEAEDEPDSTGPARELTAFLDFLGNGAAAGAAFRGPGRKARARVHEEAAAGDRPELGELRATRAAATPLAGSTAPRRPVVSRTGPRSMTGGGDAETQGALATWRNDANSTINYT